MCGITGIITQKNNFVDECLERAEASQKHRGPDVQDKLNLQIGEWSLGLGHQRLSIIDLSDAGIQPMESQSKESVVVFNGELYNYKELAGEIDEFTPRTQTDTEILLESLEHYGVDNALKKFNGMWAFAWLDKKTNKLYLVRDRIGIKPLYFYKNGTDFHFSSEVKAILEASQDKFTLNYQAVGEYLQQSLQDTNNNSFYQEIEAVPAGHYLEIDLNSKNLMPKLVRYWNVFDAEEYSGTDLVEHTKQLFADSIKLRMRSDVQVGVTLSGGLDSSAISTFMKEQLGSADNLNILSVVSPGSKLDESEFIDEMVSYLGAKVHKIELNWTAKDAVELLEKVTWHNDSPVGSFSNVAHYLMMKKAHELGITVILSGQGADEILCGYKKYLGFYAQELKRQKKYFKLISLLAGFLFNRSILNQFNFKEAKRYLPKKYQGKEINVIGSKLKLNYKPVQIGLLKDQSLQHRQASDLEKFSVPFLTHYEDRMSMAWSREIRLPFLDHRLVELFVKLPANKKMFKGWTKYIFRQAMNNHLPQKINWRKDKQGFVTPQENWLRDELKEEVLSKFQKDALIFQKGLIDRDKLLEKYKLFCEESSSSGKVWYRDIFAPFALEIWLQKNKQYLK